MFDAPQLLCPGADAIAATRDSEARTVNVSWADPQPVIAYDVDAPTVQGSVASGLGYGVDAGNRTVGVAYQARWELENLTATCNFSFLVDGACCLHVCVCLHVRACMSVIAGMFVFACNYCQSLPGRFARNILTAHRQPAGMVGAGGWQRQCGE